LESKRINLSSLLAKEGEAVKREEDFLDRIGQDSDSYERRGEELDSMLLSNKSLDSVQDRKDYWSTFTSKSKSMRNLNHLKEARQNQTTELPKKKETITSFARNKSEANDTKVHD